MGKFDGKFHISIEEETKKKNLGHNTPVLRPVGETQIPHD